jgi:hypothetical protein
LKIRRGRGFRGQFFHNMGGPQILRNRKAKGIKSICCADCVASHNICFATWAQENGAAWAFFRKVTVPHNTAARTCFDLDELLVLTLRLSTMGRELDRPELIRL